MTWLTIGIDTGGTFTDVFAVDDNGRTWQKKVPSTPADFSLCFVNGVEAILKEQPISRIRLLLHGTTVATNALLEDQLPRIGLIVTRGFREILETTRHSGHGDVEGEPLSTKALPLVPLEYVRELDERTDAQGYVRVALDPDEIRALARWFKRQGISTVAVALLHSYANPAHEQRVKALLQAERSELSVVLSSDVLPESHEYERTITTCLNAVLMPVIGDYLQKLQRQLRERDWSTPFLLMQSSGGLVSSPSAREKPLTTALSGPSAAVIGMAWLSTHAGFSNVITLDMGGTSTDVALVKDGAPLRTTTSQIHVYPLRMPTLDIVSIGAGGGSIASWSPEGRLLVGPRSAGAEPGPVCYARGGHAVTVTDAQLVLGRLPECLVGGALSLDRQAAEDALAVLGKKKGLSAVATAAGIIQIANHNMCSAIRQVSVRRGYDPREYVLVAAGGAGPLHATELAELLGIATVLIPPSPGLVAALGLVVADVQLDFARTVLQRERSFTPGHINEIVTSLEQQAWNALANEGVPKRQRNLQRTFDFRYRDLSTEWTVDCPAGALTDESLAQAVEQFHQLHYRICGHAYRGQREVELTKVRVGAIGIREKPSITRLTPATARVRTSGTRSIFFLTQHEFLTCPIYERNRFGAGTTLTGPAVVEQYDATVLVTPGWNGRVDLYGNLILQRG
jgi:N-methylhydantoinase A